MAIRQRQKSILEHTVGVHRTFFQNSNPHGLLNAPLLALVRALYQNL